MPSLTLMASVTTASAPGSAPPPVPRPSLLLPIVVGGTIGLLLSVSLMLVVRHFRRKSKEPSGSREVQAGETVSRSHPAALMITPAQGKGTPRFIHTPGTNMRIATRRPDGAWDFADPRAPFTPEIIADVPQTTDQSSAAHSPYSYGPVPGSVAELQPPPQVASLHLGSPSKSESPSPWRTHSPAGSTAPLLPPPSLASHSRNGSAYSSNDSFLEMDSEPLSISSRGMESVSAWARDVRAPNAGSPLRDPPMTRPEPRRPPRPSQDLDDPMRPAGYPTRSHASRQMRTGSDAADREPAPRAPRRGPPAYL